MLKCIILSFWFVFHPVHVSLTSIDYIQENGSLKAFVKMYFDDFLLDLGLSGEGRTADYFISTDPASGTVIEEYLNNRLKVSVNNKILTGKLIKFEIVDNEVRLNIDYKTSGQPKTIVIRNTIMTDLYKDQSNLLIVKVNDYEEGMKLTAEITEQTFNIKKKR